MKILLLGDIVGAKTIQYLGKVLWALRRDQNIDMVVANGENASDIMGLSAEDAQALLNYGVDVITGGNHTFHNRSLYRMLDDSPFLLRPANCADAAPGVGSTIFECCGTRIFVLNLLGMMSLDAYASPFDTADRILKREAGKFDFALVDFHAESTAEKEALGYYLDGRAAAVFGTHTHVQTADAHILPGGTAYITDLGMCGPTGGVLGTDRDVILKRFLTGTPQKFIPADGDIHLHGALLILKEHKAERIELFRL